MNITEQRKHCEQAIRQIAHTAHIYLVNAAPSHDGAPECLLQLSDVANRALIELEAGQRAAMNAPPEPEPEPQPGFEPEPETQSLPEGA
jgi:hypothetical protein